jgi:hypothetical protein
MTFPDFLGHIGYLSITVGVLLLARQNIWGWVFRGVGEALWVIVGLMVGLTSAWIWGIIFLFIEVYGYRKWKKAGH